MKLLTFAAIALIAMTTTACAEVKTQEISLILNKKADNEVKLNIPAPQLNIQEVTAMLQKQQKKEVKLLNPTDIIKHNLNTIAYVMTGVKTEITPSQGMLRARFMFTGYEKNLNWLDANEFNPNSGLSYPASTQKLQIKRLVKAIEAMREDVAAYEALNIEGDSSFAVNMRQFAYDNLMSKLKNITIAYKKLEKSMAGAEKMRQKLQPYYTT